MWTDQPWHVQSLLCFQLSLASCSIVYGSNAWGWNVARPVALPTMVTPGLSLPFRPPSALASVPLPQGSGASASTSPAGEGSAGDPIPTGAWPWASPSLVVVNPCLRAAAGPFPWKL